MGRSEGDETFKPRLVRDPVYNIYRFEDETDRLALQLVDTPAFQRLRRIKQLGFSDYVYPGASHTRFAHSIGVYATAKKLIKVIEKQSETPLEPGHVQVALLAALLHDIGHGPFSHAFEAVHKDQPRLKKKHEEWSASIITEDKHILGILGVELAKKIAKLLTSDAQDYYEAIVSSSFDADRLDYVRRDRIMSGTGTGAIDFEWLMEHVRFDKIAISKKEIRTFTLDPKAVQQAEIFLLARYHLYDQVYFHKVNRGMECLLAGCLKHLAEFTRRGRWQAVGLPEDNHLVRFLHDPNVETYLGIDDTVVMAALQQIATPEHEKSGDIRDLAYRVINRVKPWCLNLEKLVPPDGSYDLTRDRALAYVEENFEGELNATIFFDEPRLSIYGQAKDDDIKVHKKLWIHSERGDPKEITAVSRVISDQAPLRRIGRLFFLDKAQRDEVETFLLAPQ